MREIKFRAWNAQKKIMMWRGLFDRNWYTDSRGGKCIQGIHPDDYLNLKVMKCTDLKDANGVEIYEGDILKANGEYPAVVDFKSGSFVLKHINYAGTSNIPVREVSTCSYKVIGNIHENPELLETQND